jgi:hypothetical protein
VARAFALGEDYYALNGSGTSQPFGLLTAIGASGTYVSTFSSPSDSTVAGSVAAAVATEQVRWRTGAVADGSVMNTADYWRMRRQGADTAGFWIDPAAPANQDLSLFGIPLPHTPNIATDNLVVGEFTALQFFRGQGYRVDTSSEAGDRWDKNLTGFRGEGEIAMDTPPAVYAGMSSASPRRSRSRAAREVGSVPGVTLSGPKVGRAPLRCTAHLNTHPVAGVASDHHAPMHACPSRA